MNRCETCRHWLSKDGATGVCGAVPDRSGCVQVSDPPPGKLAEVQSVYDCTYSSLVTAWAFGCVLHEAKETG